MAGKNFGNAKVVKKGKSPRVMSTNRRAPVAPKLESTNSSKRKVSTDFRPQPK